MTFSVGQMRYFSDRRVQLCYAIDGDCTDNSKMLGFTSSLSKSSPIASVVSYNLTPAWTVSGSWSFDVFQNETDNADMSMQYEPETTHHHGHCGQRGHLADLARRRGPDTLQ